MQSKVLIVSTTFKKEFFAEGKWKQKISYEIKIMKTLEKIKFDK